MVETINAVAPDIVLVGMGSPKQELWVDRNAARLDVRVLWTVGALFDYISGRVPRAPAGSPTMASNGSFDSGSSRSGCGDATSWGTRCSCRG